jgi:hypothetical protein
VYRRKEIRPEWIQHMMGQRSGSGIGHGVFYHVFFVRTCMAGSEGKATDDASTVRFYQG